ncbi:MAG: choice-of-anchor J domain-containing protein [Ignavibacteriae bacterium]|nr:choice-of-anchor J domain-containing protein [Ignavibacteriota bacterium]
MKKVIFTFLVLLFFVPAIFAQRVIVNQNFETTGFGIDSMPPGWLMENVDPVGGPGKQWAVRDSGTGYVGTSQYVIAKAHNSKRALTIPWSAGNPVADDWVFTDTFKVQTGDSLIFWMLFGSPAGMTPYIDTMQVWTMYDQSSVLTLQKLGTLKSNDSAGVPLATNVWKIFKFSLSAFAGQTICIAFRYFMDTSVDGLWCNIDDVFIGNHSSVGISQIGNNIPKKFALSQNYPNPFNPTTKIKFDVPKNGNVTVEVFNNLGQVVSTLHNGYTNAGYYETNFDGSKLTSGIYFYRMTSNDFTETKKMILVK